MVAVQDDTKTRLIEAAGVIFADKGFDAAGVREICQEAKANVAAVKYYFGDKRKLYKAVLQHVHACKDNLALQMAEEQLKTQPPLIQLKFYILEMVREHLASQKPAWHLEIMLWEMTRQTAEGREVIELQLRPMATLLKNIIRQLVGDEVSEETVWKSGFSIVGQVLFYHVHQAIARQLAGDAIYEELTVDQIAEHIYQFSIAGLAAVAKRPLANESAAS